MELLFSTQAFFSDNNSAVTFRTSNPFTSPGSISSWGWTVPPSSSSQSPVIVPLQLPTGFTAAGAQLDVTFILTHQSATGSTINIQIIGAFASSGTTIVSGAMPNINSSGTIAITEPAAATSIEILKVTVNLTSLPGTAVAGNWGTIGCLRIAPTGTEYAGNIYVSTMVLRYTHS